MYDDRDHDDLSLETEQVAPDWLRINVTSPALAPGTMQEAELKLIGEQLRRGPDGVLDDDALGGLATSGRSGASRPATEWMRVTSSASAGASSGRIPGNLRPSIVFPVPGGPASRRL